LSFLLLLLLLLPRKKRRSQKTPGQGGEAPIKILKEFSVQPPAFFVIFDYRPPSFFGIFDYQPCLRVKVRQGALVRLRVKVRRGQYF
jgi:hypothetical protein